MRCYTPYSIQTIARTDSTCVTDQDNEEEGGAEQRQQALCQAVTRVKGQRLKHFTTAYS